MDSAFAVAKGDSTWLDLSDYQTTTKSYTSFLTFSWSIIAEIDIESEIIRFMGFLRMDLWGVWRTIFLRRYRARFSYLPPTGDKRMVELPPLNEPLPENEGWVIAEDTFILFWASHVSHAGEAMFHSPQSKIDDGAFTIFIVR
jgi:sphingosine kinase